MEVADPNPAVIVPATDRVVHAPAAIALTVALAAARLPKTRRAGKQPLRKHVAKQPTRPIARSKNVLVAYSLAATTPPPHASEDDAKPRPVIQHPRPNPQLLVRIVPVGVLTAVIARPAKTAPRDPLRRRIQATQGSLTICLTAWHRANLVGNRARHATSTPIATSYHLSARHSTIYSAVMKTLLTKNPRIPNALAGRAAVVDEVAVQWEIAPQKTQPPLIQNPCSRMNRWPTREMTMDSERGWPRRVVARNVALQQLVRQPLALLLIAGQPHVIEVKKLPVLSRMNQAVPSNAHVVIATIAPIGRPVLLVQTEAHAMIENNQLSVPPDVNLRIADAMPR